MARKNKDIEILVKLATQGNFDEAQKQLNRLKTGQTDAAKASTGAFSVMQKGLAAWQRAAVTSSGAIRKAFLTILGPFSSLIIIFQTLTSVFGQVFRFVKNFRDEQEKANKMIRESGDLLNRAAAAKEKYANATTSEKLTEELKVQNKTLDDIIKKREEINQRVKDEGIEWSVLIPFVKGQKDALAGQAALLADMEIKLKQEIHDREIALETAKKQEEQEKKRLSAMDSISKRIDELTLGETELKKANLERQLKDYEQAGVDKATLDQLRALETAAIEKEAADKAIQEQERKTQAIADLEAELDQKVAQLDDDALSRKIAKIDEEYRREQQKISKTVQDKAKETQLLAKLDGVRTKQIMKAEEDQARVKKAAVLSTLDTSLQAIAILNDMESGHTKAQATRAKIILALEKAIAIARIWSAPSTGPWDVGLKAAQTALVVAQFAQQSKAISQAQEAASSAAATDLSVTTPLEDGKSITETFEGSKGSSSGGSAGSAAAPASGGGGGGGTTVVDVGGVFINFDAQHVDMSEINTILRRIGDAARSGTIEGIRAAVSIVNAASKNGTKAV